MGKKHASQYANFGWLRTKRIFYGEFYIVFFHILLLNRKLPILGYPLLDGRQSAPV